MIEGEKLPTLAGPRVSLRWIVLSDAPALFAIFSHPDVMRYWSLPPWESEELARELVLRIHAGFREKSRFQWGVTVGDDPRVVGTCTLYSFHAEQRRAEIGYALARSHWGGGIMSEALGVLLDFAFGALGLRRLEADVDPRNAASVRTLERLGFAREGLLRERWCVEGEISDSAFYGLLAREWSGRGAPLEGK